MRVLFAALAMLSASLAKADLLVSVQPLLTFPYELSPQNYANSPSNYDNASSNSKNSPANTENSQGQYRNSPSNPQNGATGDRRLIFEDEGKAYRVGYYARANTGVLNFFSVKGKRLFYAPASGIGVFNALTGSFCGAMAQVEDTLQLVLTEQGEQMLLLGE